MVTVTFQVETNIAVLLVAVHELLIAEESNCSRDGLSAYALEAYPDLVSRLLSLRDKALEEASVYSDPMVNEILRLVPEKLVLV